MTNYFEQEHYLDKKLISYSNSDYYPFHMPGHKRRAVDFPNPYTIDITEIEGFDNLHHAEGILKDAQNQAAKIYKSKETFYLINGSTCGILSAISAVLPRGGTLLMGRNCHKAVYHGAFLRQLKTSYILPAMTDFGIMGSITPQDVADSLDRHPEAQAVFITSPTYDGVVSDIKMIADIVHDHNCLLIVDEAHGAHFTFSKKFPTSALECGADIVIHSLHKTLPCFTQTALLHVNSDRVPLDNLKRFLGIYQTSSPSYLLMSSMVQGLRTMEEHGTDLITDFTQALTDFYQQTGKLHHLQIFTSTLCQDNSCFDWDFSKIIIASGNTGLTGQELNDILLEKYHLQMEMASGHYIIALTSLMDTQDGFKRLAQALLEIDNTCRSMQKTGDTLTCQKLYNLPQQMLTLSDAMEKDFRTISLKEAAGCISQEYIFLYPPGIPLITPGEVITSELIDHIYLCQIQGLSVEGLTDMSNKTIRVVLDTIE